MLKNKKIALPDYTLKVSSKARNVWIRISDEKGLEIVIPRWFKRKDVPDLLMKEQEWIRRTRKRLREQRKLHPREPLFILPTHIHLKAIGEFWKLKYQTLPLDGIRITHNFDSTLTVSGDIRNVEKCREALREWLAEKARNEIIPWIKHLSKKFDLPIKKILIKGQRTIWGSCSRTKTISINYKLLLIPRELVRYVIIHELCHTIHLNHSQSFWKKVAKKEPNFKKYDNELRPAWQSLPSWVHKQ